MNDAPSDALIAPTITITLRARDATILLPWDRATCYACGDLQRPEVRGRQSICDDCMAQANEYADSFVPLALYAAGAYWEQWIERRRAESGAS